jgi:hypothetical protein
MGVKKAVKHWQPPEAIGLVKKVTKNAIGIVKGKQCRVYTNPYAGGERPGKLAKLNAVSATANQSMQPPLASQPTSAHTLPPTFIPPPVSQPIPGPVFSHTLPPSHTLAPLMDHGYRFLAAPTYMFLPATAL